MTEKASETLLWDADGARAGMWATRERLTLQGICLIIIAFFREDLTGMKNSGLRDVLFYVLPQDKLGPLKAELDITIAKPN